MLHLLPEKQSIIEDFGHFKHLFHAILADFGARNSYLQVLENYSFIHWKQKTVLLLLLLETEKQKSIRVLKPSNVGWLLYQLKERANLPFSYLHENVKDNHWNAFFISDSVIKCLKAIKFNIRYFFKHALYLICYKCRISSILCCV